MYAPVGHFVQLGQIQPFFEPADLVLGAATGDWLKLRDFERLAVVYQAAAGTASEDPVITIEQADDASGGNNVALTFTDLWVKSGADIRAIAAFTRLTQTAANTYTTVGEDESLIIIEFRRDQLAAGKSFIQVSVSDPGATGTKYASCVGYFWHPHETPADPANMPSVIA